MDYREKETALITKQKTQFVIVFVTTVNLAETK